MMISNLPVELQNKIFFYAAEHPVAEIVRNQRDYVLKNTKGEWAKILIDGFGNLYSVFDWHDHKILMRTPTNLRWKCLLQELERIINKRTNNGLEPIEFDKLLKYTSRLKINDVEKKWLRLTFGTVNKF